MSKKEKKIHPPLKGFKTKLLLNNTQVTQALQHAGVARHAYNWAVEYCQNSYEQTKTTPSSVDLHKTLVATVKKENPWYYTVSKCAPQQALRNIETAYKNFHEKQTPKGYGLFKPVKKNGIIVGSRLEGLPQFKKKGKSKDSFYLEGAIQIRNNKIKIPHFGWVKCSEQLPIGEVKTVTISRVASDWFVSFKRPFEKIVTEKTKGVVGVDLGIKTLATLSDGTVKPSLRPYKKNKRKLKILQRKVSKKYVATAKQQSKNYQKTTRKVAKLHQRIANIRKDCTHKLTTDLAKNHSEIVIEDLNVSGMSKNHKLASAILDGGFFEFRRQLEYKCKWYGSTITMVDRFYPSSKTCSNCQTIKQDLQLKDRLFKCCNCGMEMDRDLNAAVNLEKQSVSLNG